MPCSDGMPRGWESQEALHRANDRNQKLQTKLEITTQQFTERTNYLEGALCALITEITKHPVGKTLISDAEENGKIDIQSFIDEHARKDMRRLKQSLSENYSQHELDMLKDILSE